MKRYSLEPVMAGYSLPSGVHNRLLAVAVSVFMVSIAGCGGGGGSGSPAIVTVSAPDAPTITSIRAGDRSAIIAFNAPVVNGGAAITRYSASCNLRSSATKATTASAASSPVVVTGLINGTTYNCVVRATNAAGSSFASVAVNTVPDATTATTAVASLVPVPYG